MKKINHIGVAVYSLDDSVEIFKKVLHNKKSFHFALEELILEKKKDIEKINNIWLIKQHSK